MNKENIKKRLYNWKVWVAVMSLVGFVFLKAGVPEAKNFLDELMPYIFAVGVSLGVWSDHEEVQKGENE